MSMVRTIGIQDVYGKDHRLARTIGIQDVYGKDHRYPGCLW